VLFNIVIVFKNFYVTFTYIYLGLEGYIIMRRMRNAMHVLYM